MTNPLGGHQGPTIPESLSELTGEIHGLAAYIRAQDQKSPQKKTPPVPAAAQQTRHRMFALVAVAAIVAVTVLGVTWMALSWGVHL